MTGETPEVRSDKKKPREDRQNHRYHGFHRQREKERKGEKNMFRVNYDQSAFNSLSKTAVFSLNILSLNIKQDWSNFSLELDIS